MKIAIMTSAHPIDDVRVMTKVAQGFRDAGHDVTWCGPNRVMFAPEPREGFTWHLTPYRAGMWGRVVALVRGAWRVRTLKDLDWIYTPDPDAALAALLLGRLTGANTLFDIHEDFHNGPLRRVIKNPRARTMLSGLVRHLIRLAARHSTQTIAVSQTILDAYTRSCDHGLVVLNSPPRAFCEAPNLSAGRKAGRMKAMHGKAIWGNGSEVVAEALELLDPGDAPTTIFIVKGADGTVFAPDLVERLSRRGLQGKVEQISGVPHGEMPGLLEQCGFGMIAYGRDLGETSLPNRLFEYMAAGCAVLAPSYSPEIVAILERHACGETTDFEEPAKVAELMRQFVRDAEGVRDMGERGRQAFVEHFAWEAQMGKLLGALACHAKS